MRTKFNRNVPESSYPNTYVVPQTSEIKRPPSEFGRTPGDYFRDPYPSWQPDNKHEETDIRALAERLRNAREIETPSIPVKLIPIPVSTPVPVTKDLFIPVNEEITEKQIVFPLMNTHQIVSVMVCSEASEEHPLTVSATNGEYELFEAVAVSNIHTHTLSSPKETDDLLVRVRIASSEPITVHSIEINMVQTCPEKISTHSES